MERETTFTDDPEDYVQGLSVGSVTISGHWDPSSAVTAQLFAGERRRMCQSDGVRFLGGGLV